MYVSVGSGVRLARPKYTTFLFRRDERDPQAEMDDNYTYKKKSGITEGDSGFQALADVTAS